MPSFFPHIPLAWRHFYYHFTPRYPPTNLSFSKMPSYCVWCGKKPSQKCLVFPAHPHGTTLFLLSFYSSIPTSPTFLFQNTVVLTFSLASTPTLVLTSGLVTGNLHFQTNCLCHLPTILVHTRIRDTCCCAVIKMCPVAASFYFSRPHHYFSSILGSLKPHDTHFATYHFVGWFVRK